MSNLLNFFIEIGKLKRKNRKGMMFYGIKDPETTAEHTFRMTIVAWFLGTMENMNIEKVIKTSLVHDLCEVYAGDITPYDGLLPKDEKEKYDFVRKWPHLSQEIKKKRHKEKQEKERRSLEKLVKNLEPKVKKEILNLWWDLEIGKTKEARFARQIDRAENLIEAFDCWQRDKNFPTKPWWQHADEAIDDELVQKFLKEIEFEELGIKNEGRDPLMLNFLKFFNEIRNLKETPRRGWVINKIENPESIAEHTFRATIMAWFLGKKKKKLNLERLLKIALVHSLGEVYIPVVASNGKKQPPERPQTWPIIFKTEKDRISKEKYDKENKSLIKLVANLPKDLRNEVKNLWLDYKKGLTPEGRFFKQINRAESFLQSLEYWKKYKKPAQGPWWDWASKFFDDPLLLDFIKTMGEKFNKKGGPKE
jgi:putative hydrolase of HD superfamily